MYKSGLEMCFCNIWVWDLVIIWVFFMILHSSTFLFLTLSLEPNCKYLVQIMLLFLPSEFWWLAKVRIFISTFSKNWISYLEKRSVIYYAQSWLRGPGSTFHWPSQHELNVFIHHYANNSHNDKLLVSQDVL